MKSLKDFTDFETATVLKFTKILADEMQPKSSVAFSLDMDDDTSLKQVTDQAHALCERRKSNGGRQYRDESDEGKAIREQVRKHLRSKKLLPRD